MIPSSIIKEVNPDHAKGSATELMARVWPNLFVESSNLSVHISALRRTLRDGRDGNRFIINIPGRGYCFVAPVTLGGVT
jgi:DNA-binding winged helix-turn-helix (wHTH) protein